MILLYVPVFWVAALSLAGVGQYVGLVHPDWYHLSIITGIGLVVDFCIFFARIAAFNAESRERTEAWLAEMRCRKVWFAPGGEMKKDAEIYTASRPRAEIER